VVKRPLKPREKERKSKKSVNKPQKTTAEGKGREEEQGTGEPRVQLGGECRGTDQHEPDANIKASIGLSKRQGPPLKGKDRKFDNSKEKKRGGRKKRGRGGARWTRPREGLGEGKACEHSQKEEK